MSKVAAKQAASDIQKFPDDLIATPCQFCGRSVVWCKGPARTGTRPVAVEVGPPGIRCDVTIESELGAASNVAPRAFETNLRTRYRWHSEHCAGSFTGQARPKKAKGKK